MISSSAITDWNYFQFPYYEKVINLKGIFSMAKSQDQKKDVKKKPTKTLKEKRAAKKDKKK